MSAQLFQTGEMLPKPAKFLTNKLTQIDYHYGSATKITTRAIQRSFTQVVPIRMKAVRTIQIEFLLVAKNDLKFVKVLNESGLILPGSSR
jgi:hypothetical protein